MKRIILLFTAVFPMLLLSVTAKEYHVAKTGKDQGKGTIHDPFLTISQAAKVAMPGDTITVHAGVYREEIDPPKGGTSSENRIIYRAASGEIVEIKGSEIIAGWERVKGNVWKKELPNSFFGAFNPYSDEIKGDWFHNLKRKHHTGAVYVKGHWLIEAEKKADLDSNKYSRPCWFAEVNDQQTTIWAQFPEIDPNKESVEINVRQTVFYPSKPGVNYIAVRGFKMSHAATNWAPPTAEQKALIGTHWSKGWIIENNEISYSRCSGISLGKYGDEFDNTSEDSAEGYVETVKRALEKGWTKENIGHHTVRNNKVFNCEQAGIVGSLGCAFSEVSGNEVHDIHTDKLFSGYEMGGIKFHGAIDARISNNVVYNTNHGIWMDWMAQGTIVSDNLVFGSTQYDLYFEVNHGPFIAVNNILLSERSLWDWSDGGAFVHNLIAGHIGGGKKQDRETPYFLPHSTKEIKIKNITGGDVRYINNILVGKTAGLTDYNKSANSPKMAGNVFLNHAVPADKEQNPLVMWNFDPAIKLHRKTDGFYIEFNFDKAWKDRANRSLVTSNLLGKALTPDQGFTYPDGSLIRFDKDYLQKNRLADNPFPGPFELADNGHQLLKVWSKSIVN